MAKEIVNEKIFDLLQKKALNNKNEIALVDDNDFMTYDELMTNIDLVSQSLIDRGITNESTICLCGLATNKFLTVYISLISLGAKVAILNPYVCIEVLSKLIDYADTNYIIFEKSLHYKCDEKAKKVFSTYSNVKKENIFFVSEFFDISVKVDVNYINDLRAKSTDATFLVYTSGTELFPKLAVISEMAIINSLYALCKEFVNPDKKYNFMVALPFNHLYAVLVLLFPLLLLDGKMIVTNNLTPLNLLNTIKNNGVNVMFSIPHLFVEMAKIDGYYEEKKQIRFLYDCGSPVSDSDLKISLSAYSDARYYHAYGLTESGPVSLLCVNDATNLQYNNGKLFYGIDVKIGKNSEILLKGERLKDTYYKLDADKQGIDSEGYFHTGDIGEFDENHNLYVKGRLKDIIIKGGENISPLEIENEILKDNNVEKVVVAPKPDDKYGEEIYAYVILKDKSKFDENLMKEKIGEALGHFKIPKKIIIKDNFPLNSLGKIVKNEL